MVPLSQMQPLGYVESWGAVYIHGKAARSITEVHLQTRVDRSSEARLPNTTRTVPATPSDQLYISDVTSYQAPQTGVRRASKQQKYVSPSSEGWKCKIRVVMQPGSGVSPLPGGRQVSSH